MTAFPPQNKTNLNNETLTTYIKNPKPMKT